MDRKVALAAATAVVLTLSAGTVAVAANLGLLSSTADQTVGQLQPARSERAPSETVVIEEVVPSPRIDVGSDDAYEDGYEDDEDDEDGGDDAYEDESDDEYEDEDEYGDDDGHDDDD